MNVFNDICYKLIVVIVYNYFNNLVQNFSKRLNLVKFFVVYLFFIVVLFLLLLIEDLFDMF